MDDFGIALYGLHYFVLDVALFFSYFISLELMQAQVDKVNFVIFVFAALLQDFKKQVVLMDWLVRLNPLWVALYIANEPVFSRLELIEHGLDGPTDRKVSPSDRLDQERRFK